MTDRAALKTPASRELLDITKGCLDDAEAEVERLQAELGQVREILNDREAEVERLRALALKFLHEQTEANADALRAACEVRQ